MAKADWVILEGGDTETFPLSINQAMYWTGLKRGECSFQENTRYDLEGILSYAEPPQSSASFVALKFVNPSSAVGVFSGETKRVWAYGRWWRINYDAPYKLEYTDFGQENSTEFTVAGFEAFNEDGNNRITMIATDGEGVWFVLKQTCAYRLLNANGDSAGFKKTAAYYGMGCSNPDSYVSNAVISGNVVAAWNANADAGMRHYIWSGGDGAVELSRNVRDLAKLQETTTRCTVNWAENLVLAGGMVYDLDNKRVYYYNTANRYASITTRPYHHSKYHPTTISALGFIHDGSEGSFDVTIEYGQAAAGLAESKTYRVVINEKNSKDFRFNLELNRVIRARVWRIKITNLIGCGITQIEGFLEYASSVNAWGDP